MRTVRKMFASLARSPRGFNADGRAIGLGLAAAMETQRQDAHRSVAEFLRRSDDERVEANAA